ncbi:hypothetical protein FSP39_010072 [Pinctada imbricata]|uniref:Uncharacterized protein n=1 Tax=Pinctada imbricata TaxID=66713 RepID=A0AA88Y3Y3_PINIB|nr:hypothetical protein FSP39_010072 [Pinctada imbricata]
MDKKNRRSSKHFVLLRNLMSRYRNREVSPTDKIHDHQLTDRDVLQPNDGYQKTSYRYGMQANTDDFMKMKDTETVFVSEEGEKFKRSKTKAPNKRTSLRRMMAIRDLKKYFNKIESDFPTNVHHQLYTKPSESSTEHSQAKHLLHNSGSTRLYIDSGECRETNQGISGNASPNIMNDIDGFLEAPSPIVMIKKRRRTRDLRHAVYERQYEKKLKLPWQPVHTSTPKPTDSSKARSPCTDSDITEELLFTFLDTACLNTACPKSSTPIRQEASLPSDYSLLAQISTPVLMPDSNSTEKSAGGQGRFKKMKKIRSRLFSDSDNSSVKSYGFV